MKRVLAAVLILLGSCTSQPPAPATGSVPPTIKRQFENLLAETILSEIRESLPQMEGAARVDFLRAKSEQFNQSVNPKLLNSRMLLESRLLNFLLNSEDSLFASNNYSARLIALSSLDWEPARYERETLEELNRIDQRIAMLVRDTDLTSFDYQGHMYQIRNAAVYPEDTFDGRQDYLDRLSKEMINAQADWFDLYTSYNPSELGILGEVDKAATARTLAYSTEGLTINLDEVTDLPGFELKPIATFYGFPGLQSFVPGPADSLRAFLNLPAYTHGWAGYMLDQVGNRDIDHSLVYLYFARLHASLALADLRLQSGAWSIDDVVSYLFDNTPYSRHRIGLMVNEVRQNPGHYPAAIAGKLKFSEFNNRCLNTAGNCLAGYNQQVIERGPIPFKLLEQLLF